MSAVEERRHEYQGVCGYCGASVSTHVVLGHVQEVAPDVVRGYCEWCCADVKFARQPTGVTT